MVNPNEIKQGQPDYYLFVIDTDSYAGNFEREMCAYVTGKIGECGVGDKEAELAKQEIPGVVAQLEDLVELVPDEHGCTRPCSIFPTPGWFNHGMGGEFREGQETEALAHYKQEVEKYYGDQIKRITQIKEGTDNWTAEAKEREIKRFQEEINRANSLTTVSKYPAYKSVAIYFNSIPDSGLLEIMKERARYIAARGVGFKNENKATIEGFRLIEQRTIYKELDL
jgi:hypothetical protein